MDDADFINPLPPQLQEIRDRGRRMDPASDLTHLVEFSYQGISLTQFTCTTAFPVPPVGAEVRVNGVAVTVTEVRTAYAHYEDHSPFVLTTIEVESI